MGVPSASGLMKSNSCRLGPRQHCGSLVNLTAVSAPGSAPHVTKTGFILFFFASQSALLLASNLTRAWIEAYAAGEVYRHNPQRQLGQQSMPILLICFVWIPEPDNAKP